MAAMIRFYNLNSKQQAQFEIKKLGKRFACSIQDKPERIAFVNRPKGIK